MNGLSDFFFWKHPGFLMGILMNQIELLHQAYVIWLIILQ